MLPNQLSSVYRQYKQDTDSIAAWLASTAKKCGYPADLLVAHSPNAKQTPTKRLKGKQRKQAKVSAAKSSGPASPKGESKYIIALKDFLPLAEFIAGQTDPVVSVPDAFSKTISRLITLRRGFGLMRREQGAKPDPKAEQKHDYFVGILEAVRQSLHPRMNPTEAAATATAKTSNQPAGETPPTSSAQDLGNKFASLSVDEPSQSFIDAFADAPHARPEKQEQDTTVYEAEEQTSEVEAVFAFFVLVNDINKIRSYINWIWSNHRDGMFDLGAAAVATDVAISLARGLIEDIEPLINRVEGKAWGVLNSFFFIVCGQKGYSPEEIYADGKDNFNYDLYDIADDNYMVAARLLISCVDVLEPNILPLIKEGMFGYYDATSDRTKKSGHEKWNEDQIIILEMFTELITIIRMVPSYPVQDELIKNMKILERTGEVPFTLIFATQILLDINHIMRDATRRSFATMMDQTSTMDKHLELYLEFHKSLRIENWPASNDVGLKELSRLMAWMDKDPVYQVKAKSFSRAGIPVSPEMEPHRTLIYSPVIAGLYLYRIRYEMWIAGIAVANAWGSITYTAHLYNALQRENLLVQRWKDMDIFLMLLGNSNIWVGDARPTTLEDCFQKFCLQMGITASSFTKKRRVRQPLASRAGPRGIKGGAPVSSMFPPKYFMAAGPEMKWTAEQIDDIAARSRMLYKADEETGNISMTQIHDPQELRERERVRQQKSKARAAGKSKKGEEEPLSPGDLIKGLALALDSEKLEMAFPYTLMHRWCWMLLRNIKDLCNPTMIEMYSSNYLEKENQLPWLVGYILMAASGIDGGVRDLRLLEIAAEAFNALISTEAGQISIIVAAKMGFPISFGDDERDEDGDEDE